MTHDGYATDVENLFNHIRTNHGGLEYEIIRLEPHDFYDRFILGIANHLGFGPVLAYDQSEIVRAFINEDGMSPEVAIDYFHVNVLGKWNGDGTPLFVDGSPWSVF